VQKVNIGAPLGIKAKKRTFPAKYAKKRERKTNPFAFFRVFRGQYCLVLRYPAFVNSTPVASNEISVTVPSGFRVSNFAPSSLIR
jgi:hypothetical protein